MNDNIQGYPPESTHPATTSKTLARVTENVMNGFHEKGLNLTAVNIQPIQIPSEHNSYVAVVEACIQTNNAKFQGLGAAQPEDIEGSAHVQTLLNKATANALTNAAGTAYMASKSGAIGHGEPHGNVSPMPKDGNYQQAAKSQGRRYNHNPNKPASQNQERLISRLCDERNITQPQARVNAGLSAEGELNSPQANQLIQYLRSK